MINAVSLIYEQIKAQPKAPALWLPNQPVTTFSDLGHIASGIQKTLRKANVGPGDTVLLFDALGARMYGAVIAISALGASVALVEPWMPIHKINHVLPFVKPKVFLTNRLGKLWGVRAKSIRDIPHWLSISDSATDTASRRGHPVRVSPLPRREEKEKRSLPRVNEHFSKTSNAESGHFKQALTIEQVSGDAPGIITFTSGTTGNPKGMVRTHQYLLDQQRILSEALSHGRSSVRGADVCIFANFALSNLAMGRASLIIPPRWRPQDIKQLDNLTGSLTPSSLTCGPAFLLNLMAHSQTPTLESIHVGGALTDCAIFERAFTKWPKAEIHHLYGSTEVEPVAMIDARTAVKKSREKGYFQTLAIGQPIKEISANLTPDTLWVAGPHVCPRYLANDEENAKHKRTDNDGRIWHRMGDRIQQRGGTWWFAGREHQPTEHFQLEQKMYSLIGSSAAFIVERDHRLVAYVNEAPRRKELILNGLPEISEVHFVKIKRDRRHRSRIDRTT